ncbi:hypothetical protein [Gluconobacter cerinus]|uniref:hypothetical protein n=1 Tax=Gluconobacter cerinus TaxID=38307 RepID=UPI001C04EDAC|nr:hypothetical protein [Gluconobacter cerinus]MCW2264145.1 hypothetical protein [Gluconobacter cerinus]
MKTRIRLVYRRFWFGAARFCFRRLRFSASDGTTVLRIFMRDGVAVAYDPTTDDWARWSA